MNDNINNQRLLLKTLKATSNPMNINLRDLDLT